MPWFLAYCLNKLLTQSGELSKLPGQIQLTLTPFSANSKAKLCVKPTPPNLLAAYAPFLELPFLPDLLLI